MKWKKGTTSKKVGFFRDVAQNKFSYLIALPAIIYTFIFSYMTYPYLVLAFQRYDYRNTTIWDILFHGEWVGFENSFSLLKTLFA